MRYSPGRLAIALTAVAALVLLAAPTAAVPAPDERAEPRVQPSWRSVDVDSEEQFRGLDAVSSSIAWVGGSDGSVFRTTDGGASWDDVSPRGTDGLLFRDVEAWDALRATVLAIGPGDASRIYRTTDGGFSWQRVFTNRAPRAFYDCMAFWGAGRYGIAVSDPVDGRFRILATDDNGLSWEVLPDRGMPRARDGEFAFAASGTCLVAEGRRQAWLASGGGASRIFHTTDRGRTWTVRPAPIPASPAGGVFSLAFDGVDRGVAVGGDFERPNAGRDASGRTRDGRRWLPGGDLSGYRSGVDWLADVKRRVAVAVGPTGSDVTYDGGRSWARFSPRNYDAVVCADDGSCWASGPEGAVGVLRR